MTFLLSSTLNFLKKTHEKLTEGNLKSKNKHYKPFIPNKIHLKLVCDSKKNLSPSQNRTSNIFLSENNNLYYQSYPSKYHTGVTRVVCSRKFRI